MISGFLDVSRPILYCKRFAQSAGPFFCCALLESRLPLRPPFWGPICNLGVTFGALGTTFGINFATLGSLLEHFGCTFRVKKQTGAPKVPQEAPPRKSPHPFGHLWEVSFCTFRCFLITADRSGNRMRKRVGNDSPEHTKTSKPCESGDDFTKFAFFGN